MSEKSKTKACKSCKKEKDLDEFYRNKYQKDGLNYYCIDCVRVRNEKSKEFVSGAKQK